MAEIVQVYSLDIYLELSFFPISKIFIRFRDTPEKVNFWVSKPQIVSLDKSILSVHGRCLKFL